MSFSIGDKDLYPLVGRRNGLRVLGALVGRRGATFTELLSEFGVSTATMSGTLKSLEKAGYLTKRRYGNRSFYSITQKGERALAEFYDDRRALSHVADLVMERITRMGLVDGSEGMNEEEVREMVEKEVRSFLNGIDSKIRGQGT